MIPRDHYLTYGWVHLPHDPVISAWAIHALPFACASTQDPAQQADWLRCGDTWFVGVDALPNGEDGAIGASGPLCGGAFDLIRDLHGAIPPLHRAQISAVYPGYPIQGDGEPDEAFKFRQTRDAAHVDGLKPYAPGRRRIDECHQWILGLPLSWAGDRAAPLVVWSGSHQIIRAALLDALAPYDPANWGEIDVTDAYTAARRKVFETCPRVELPARPGEATLIHRHCLHGVAPWAAPPKGDRLIAYFRPAMPGGAGLWLGDDPA